MEREQLTLLAEPEAAPVSEAAVALKSKHAKPTLQIPDKQYFKIGEVAEIAGVEPYVLRYWETEFRQIKPEKTRSNQRMYSRRTLEVVLQIRSLLYEEGYKIEGAKRRLRELAGETPSVSTQHLATSIYDTLDALDHILDEDEAGTPGE